MEPRPEIQTGSVKLLGPDDWRNRSNLQNMSISELVSELRDTFIQSDFDVVEETLVVREAMLKAEIKEKKKEIELLEEKIQKERLEKVSVEMELKRVKEERYKKELVKNGGDVKGELGFGRCIVEAMKKRKVVDLEDEKVGILVEEKRRIGEQRMKDGGGGSGSAGMAPLTSEERRAARARQAVVQVAVHPSHSQDELIETSTRRSKAPSSHPGSKRRRPNTAMIVTPVDGGAEEHAEPEAPPHASRETPREFPAGTWHSELVVGRYGADEVSMWDVEYPFDNFLKQLTSPEDEVKMKELGITQSLDAMRSYSLWTSALANSTEKLCREQREQYIDAVNSLKEKISRLHSQFQDLENLHIQFKEKAELDLNTFAQKLRCVEKAKSDLQSRLASLQGEHDRLLAKIVDLENSSVNEYDNGFNKALDQVQNRFPDINLSGIHPD